MAEYGRQQGQAYRRNRVPGSKYLPGINIRDIVDESTKDIAAGAAFHGYSVFDEKNIEQVTSRLCHEIIGDMNHGMCAFYDWNLLLDEKEGPNHQGIIATHHSYMIQNERYSCHKKHRVNFTSFHII